MKLIQWNPEWDDECDFPGFVVMEDDEWDEYQAELKERYDEDGMIYWGFGGNQCTDYESLDELMEEFEVVDISEADITALKNTVGTAFGSSLP